jgi:hypothetical protein
MRLARLLLCRALFKVQRAAMAAAALLDGDEGR